MDKLTKLAVRAGGKSVLRTLVDPQFERTTRVHDWRNYISDELREIWEQLTVRERMIAFILASEAAANEEWD